jgi:hypothetical protein
VAPLVAEAVPVKLAPPLIAVWLAGCKVIVMMDFKLPKE